MGWTFGGFLRAQTIPPLNCSRAIPMTKSRVSEVIRSSMPNFSHSSFTFAARITSQRMNGFLFSNAIWLWIKSGLIAKAWPLCRRLPKEADDIGADHGRDGAG